MAKLAGVFPGVKSVKKAFTLIGSDPRIEWGPSVTKRFPAQDLLGSPKEKLGCHHGSRMASFMPRSMPPSRYIATDRVPTLTSPVRVMPGIKRKFWGTSMKFACLTEQRAL